MLKSLTNQRAFSHPFPLKKVFNVWWPLAGSWLMMALEMPALSAVIARLSQPEINLAAYGGIVFPLALIIESPIIMLLAASTALSKDWPSYQLIRRFMTTSSVLLTTLHFLIAFTPLYYFVVEGIIGAPVEIVEPARIGLMIMIPWTWSIAYRRFNQGVLIRFGHSKTIGLGTMIRLSTNIVVLGTGYAIGTLPGIVVGASAVACGVLAEALYVRRVVQPVLHNELAVMTPRNPPLTWSVFWVFYIPLVMTSLLTLLANPIGSAALSRMPLALESLAIWPVITSLVFIFRSLGIAYNEVVVASLDNPHAYANLKRFTTLLAAITTGILLIVAVTQLSPFWFQRVTGLPPRLAEIAQSALWLALPLPGLSVLQSWYQGAILYGQRTRGITESVVIYLAVSVLVLGTGVYLGKSIGLFVGILGLTASVSIQTAWLWVRARPVLRDLKERQALILLENGESLG